jgi:pantetheine-phosphate adenylyltransferase
MVSAAGGQRAVYPGTFAPITAGHLDIIDRARRLFARLTVLVAVNADKEPTAPRRNGRLSCAAGFPRRTQRV